ncbi:MAG: hypothetical protein RLZZ450_7531 [Pseudomonadota bacterium]|jgi:hypothetical protein
MIDEQTLEKLRTMRLHAMADFVQTMLLKGAGSDLSSAELIGMMIDHEWTARENRRMGLLLKNAKIPAKACVEDIWCEPARGLDKSVIRSLATCQWVRAKQNVIVVGKTGVGKTSVPPSRRPRAVLDSEHCARVRPACCTSWRSHALTGATRLCCSASRRPRCSCSTTSSSRR